MTGDHCVNPSPPTCQEQRPKHPDSIHACDWPGCSRSYRKLDHLNRHRKTHVGRIGYKCSICRKEYSRSDVLARHLSQAHGQKAGPVGRPRKGLRRPSNSSENANKSPTFFENVEMDESRQSALILLSHGQSVDGLVSNEGTADRHQAGQPSVHSSTPSSRYLDENRASRIVDLEARDHSAERGAADTASGSTRNQSKLSAVLPSDQLEDPETILRNLNSNAWFPDSQTNAHPHPGDLSVLLTDRSPVAYHDPLFDWGFSDFDSYAFPSPQANPLSSTLNSTMMQPTSALPELNIEIIKALKAEEVDGSTNVDDLPDGSPKENTWPNVNKVDTSDGLVALPGTRPASPKSHVMIDVPTMSVNAQARISMQILAQHAHQSLWPLPDLATFPSTKSLTSCINLYLVHFSSWLPIVDSPRGSFRVDKAAPILLMAMAAIGSVYGSRGLEALASPLNELVRREIAYTREYDQRFVFEPCVVQSSLLQSYLGLYSGSPRLIQQAEVSRASLVAACRRMHLLRSTYSAKKELERRGPAASLQEKTRASKQDHRNSRLGWSIFLLDAQLACLFGLPAQYPITDIQICLPVPAADSPSLGIPFKEVMANLLDRGQLLEQPSDMGLSCLSYALYRLCVDASTLSHFSSEKHLYAPYNLAFPSYNKHPQALLDQLAYHTLNAMSTLTALRLSCVALAHHAHLQFSGIGLLDQIQVAAGKLGDQPSRDTARTTVAEWLGANPAGARNIFAHAAMLRCLLGRFTFDTPTEVIWTFDSALCLWACLALSHFGSSLMSGGREYVLSWKAPPALDEWIESGDGEVCIQGLGSGEDINTEAVLRGAAERLDVMSWGLAVRYRKVLKDLLTESEMHVESVNKI